MMKFYFDGTEVDCPDSWQDIESSLKYDEAVRGILVVENANLDFTGTAYDYLQTKADDGFCNTIDVLIKDSCGSEEYVDLIAGMIFISDVTFNERTCTASVKLRDKSFYSLINNNKNIKAACTVNVSKNFVEITPAPVYNLDVYGLNNVVLLNNVPSYRMIDVLKNIIAFITDNRITVESSLFDIGGDFEGLCITNGYMLRTATQSTMTEISLSTITKELTAIAPIKFAIENTYTAPVMRIELESYFNGSGTAFTADNVYEITRKFAVESLWANIRIGSTTTDTDTTLSFPESIKYVGFYDEKFYITGECNIDSTLDLSGDWVRSSNVIERITVDGSQAYDDTVILFQSTLTDATNGRTTNSNFLQLNPPTYYYNEALTNQAILDRYLGAIPSNLAAVAGAVGDGLFKANLSSAYAFGTGSVSNLSVDFTTVSYNTGGYFDGTDTFTAAVSGVFDMTLNIEVNVTSFSGASGGQVSFSFIQKNSAGVQIDTITGISPTKYFATGTFTRTQTTRIVMNAGDTLQVAFVKIDSFGVLSSGNLGVASYWQCEENTVGAGIYTDYDSLDFPINIYEFEYPLSYEDWVDLVNDPKKEIAFAMEGQRVRRAYISDITRNHAKGTAKFKLKNSYRQDAT